MSPGCTEIELFLWLWGALFRQARRLFFCVGRLARSAKGGSLIARLRIYWLPAPGFRRGVRRVEQPGPHVRENLRVPFSSLFNGNRYENELFAGAA